MIDALVAVLDAGLRRAPRRGCRERDPADSRARPGTLAPGGRARPLQTRVRARRPRPDSHPRRGRRAARPGAVQPHPVSDPARARRPRPRLHAGVPEVELEPEVVLVVLLPPLLYSAAYFTPLRELRRNVRAISLLAVGLVLATMVGVAVVAHAALGFGWAEAFVLGAIVSPTDPVAATAIARRLNVPEPDRHDRRGRGADQRRHRARRLQVRRCGGGHRQLQPARRERPVRHQRDRRDRRRDRRRRGDRLRQAPDRRAARSR